MYNKKIKIIFLKKIRDIVKFKDLNELRNAIESDVREAKDYFKRG
jgi:FAD synthase